MRTLVIDTATAACSVALLDDAAVAAAAHEVVGRGHAERLVPMIGEVLDGTRPDAILVDCGPGSFTGIRVGIAAARGLGIGWGIPVHGYSSLALLAAQGFAEHPDTSRLAIVLEGGHGEVFMQCFAASPFLAEAPPASMAPAAALARVGTIPVRGNGVRHLIALDPAIDATERLPEAAALPFLPPAFRALPPTPIYGREPDAKLPA